jgi:AraC family transcriptional activator of tynA and feaB
MVDNLRTTAFEPSLGGPPASGPSAESVRRGRSDETVEIEVDGGLVLPGKIIEPLGQEPATLRIRSRSFAEIDLSEIAAPPLKVTQASGDRYRYHLILLLEGYGTYRSADDTFTQRPGDFVLLDTARPCQVVSPVGARLLRWSLPEDLLAPFLPVPDAALHLPAGAGLMAVLSNHTQELAREAHELDREAQRRLLTHLCGLLGLAIEAHAAPQRERRCNYRAYQRQRILSYLEAHICDCGLTAKRAAKDLGISPRWLHALLEESGCRFRDLVTSRRLAKSRWHLEDPASDNLSIAEIAFLSGFNDLSTFYRRFGEHHQRTPGEVRRTRQQAA